MMALIRRKVLLILIALPLINFLGFQYGKIAPQLFPESLQFFQQSAERLNRDYPPADTYFEYLQGVVKGDWGHAGLFPITTILAQSTGNSLLLMGAAIFSTIIIGPILGMLLVSYETKRITPLGLVVAVVGVSMPRFFIGEMILGLMIYAVLIFGISAGTPLPISGFGYDEHLILPIIVLGIGPTLRITGITARLIEQELKKDYIRVAESKGLHYGAIYFKHVLPNIASPIIVTIGNSMRLLIGGLIVVEMIFLWPGLGRMFMFIMGLSVNTQADLVYFLHRELLAAVALLFGIWLLLVDLVTTVLAYLADPRMNNPNEMATR